MQRPKLKSLITQMLFATVAVCGAHAQAFDARPYFDVGKDAAAIEAQFSLDDIYLLSSRALAGDKIQVVGVASPDGDRRQNERLAQRRAQSMLQQMKKATGLSDEAFEMSGQVLSWQHLARYVAADSTQVPMSCDVLELLSNADDGTASSLAVTRKLRALGGGTPYLYIKEHILPLMRTSITATGDEIPEFSVEQSIRLADGEEIYQALLAQRGQQGEQQASQWKKTQGNLQEEQPQQDGLDQNSGSSHSSSSDIAETPENPVFDDSTTTETEDSAGVEEEKVKETDKTDNKTDNLSTGFQQKASDKSSSLGFWIVIAALAGLLIVFFVHSRRQMVDKNDQIRYADTEMARKTQQVGTLKAKIEQKDREISALKSELAKKENELKQKDVEIASLKGEIALANEGISERQSKKGQLLYQHLVEGGVAANWTNDQIHEFVNYYKIVNLPLVEHLENDFEQLSPNHMLYLILVDMGKADNEIQHILNISQTTIRSLRFRIKSKQKKR